MQRNDFYVSTFFYLVLVQDSDIIFVAIFKTGFFEKILMKTIYNDIETWEEQFTNKSNEGRYDLVINTLKAPLTESFIEDLDLGGVLVQMLGNLEKEKQFDKLLNLIEVCISSQPTLYKKEHFYFDDFLVRWYLFHQEKEKLIEPLTRFKENPVKGIDHMLTALKNLLFYGHTDLAVHLAEKTFEPVENSPKLIGGSGYQLAVAMYYNYLEQHYKQYLDTHEFNREQFENKINTLKFEFAPGTMDLIEKAIIGNQDIAEVFHQEFFRNRHGCMLFISGHFLKYMYHKKQMRFACSGVLWDGLLNYWEKHTDDETIHPDTFFSLDSDTFDKYLVDVIGGFLAFNKADAVAILWGATYVYDFLLSIGIIKERDYKETITNIYSLKARIIKAFTNDLWEFNFVHRWELPERVTKEESCAEEEIFVKSLRNKLKDFKEFFPIVKDEFDKIPDLSRHLFNQRASASAQKQPKVGRNMPCPCGSGKKFKKCCDGLR